MARKIKWGIVGCGGIARRRTIPEGIVPALVMTKEEVDMMLDRINEAIRAAMKHFGL